MCKECVNSKFIYQIMSIVFKNECFCIIDHQEYVSQIFNIVSVINNDKESYKLSPVVFSIRGKEAIIIRKRCHDSDIIQIETTSIKENYEAHSKCIPEEIKRSIRDKFNLLPATEVRDIAKSLFEEAFVDHTGITGGNNGECSIKCNVKGQEFLIPPHCRFHCGDVKEQCSKLNEKYDIVIADPPWWNKFIRRLKSANNKLSYSMMYNEDIASIPIQNLFSDNCLIAVWCTNAPSNIDAVKNLIFPKWGVEYVTTWYWLKVDIDLKPVCGFSAGHKKQPYERLILGKVGNVKKVPEDMLFMSVPSALHSHKPPILELLSPYTLVEQPATLELFARYLLPHTTSVGFEPLKWQHIALYQKVR